MKNKSFVDTNNSRPGSNYEQVIRQIQTEGVCPFCSEQLLKFHKNPIEHETKWWRVTNNMYPYNPTKHHVLFIHKEHVEHVSEMTAEAWSDLLGLFQKVCKERGIEGGTLMMRFGITRYTGASVSHLHAHILQSDPDHPDYKKEKIFTGLPARVG